MRKRITCEICGTGIDKSACNDSYGVFSDFTDTDETGMKTERFNLCGSCMLEVKLFILQKRNKRYAEGSRILE